jgi:hypothetical protein
MSADGTLITGRAPREEEDAQGPCKEENNIHPTIRECYDDWWEEEGTLSTLSIYTCGDGSLVSHGDPRRRSDETLRRKGFADMVACADEP